MKELQQKWFSYPKETRDSLLQMLTVEVAYIDKRKRELSQVGKHPDEVLFKAFDNKLGALEAALAILEEPAVEEKNGKENRSTRITS